MVAPKLAWVHPVGRCLKGSQWLPSFLHHPDGDTFKIIGLRHCLPIPALAFSAIVATINLLLISVGIRQIFSIVVLTTLQLKAGNEP